MKAFRLHRNGEPADVLAWEDAPDLTPGPGQVHVRVLAAAVNFPDVLLCRGQYQVRPPLPFTPGAEACGEVLAVGPGVTHVGVGDRVAGIAALPVGAYGEEALLAAPATFVAPAAFDDAQAASFTIAYQTGWFGLHRRAHLAAGETLLVHAAAGGVGSAAIQLGKAAGARVIGVVGGADKAAVARDLGADVVIDRTRDDVIAAVKDATGGRGADVIYDPVGGPAYEQSTKVVAFEGRIIVVGFAAGTIQAPPLAHALVKNYSILGLHWGLYVSQDPALVAACHEELAALADSGAIAPLISQRVPMAEAPQALTRVGAGTTTGRIALMA